MEKKLENEMEALGPLKGVYRDLPLYAESNGKGTGE